ncbi:MAG TPA: DUF6044 family protein [Kiritimatiellia bacterium]|nr:DUF6044 family protein [Kiritimatiellia bacterium]
MISALLQSRPRLFWFAAWASWLTLEYWALGDLSYLRIHDTATVHIPVVMTTTDAWRSMIGSLMHPWISGMDRLANVGWWNLFYVPFLVLPPWLAHGVVTWIQRFVAGYFTARLLEESLGARREVAYLAGMVYAMAHTDLGEVAFMHLLNEPGLPLLLWFYCRQSLTSWRVMIGRSALLGVLLGWSMAHLIGTFFLVPAAYLFALILRKDAHTLRGWGVLTAGVAVFFAVSSLRMVPEIWALLLHAGDTYRGRQFGLLSAAPDWRGFGMERLGYLLRWAPFVLLAGIWLARSRLRNRVHAAVGCLLLLGVVIGPLLGPLKVYVAPYIGFARGVDFTRFHMVSALAWCLAAAGALAYVPRWTFSLRNPEGAKVRAWTLSHVVCGALMLVAFHQSIDVKQQHLRDIVKRKQSWRLLFDHPDLGTLAETARAAGYRFATAGAYYNLHPGFWLPYGADMVDGLSPAYSERYYRFWTGVIRPLTELDRQIRGFHTWGAYVYLHHARSGPDHDVSAIPFARWYNLDLLSLAGAKYIVSDKDLDDDRLVPVRLPEQDAMTVAWANLSRRERLLGYLQRKNPPRQLVVHENPRALPTFFLVPGVRLFDEEDDLFRTMEASSINDFASQVYVLESDLAGLSIDPTLFGDAREPGAGRVQMTGRDGASFQVAVETPVPQVLVFNHQYFRWWSWYIEGDPLAMFPAYGTFMAAVIPPGRHVVNLVYRPPYAGMLTFLAGGRGEGK